MYRNILPLPGWIHPVLVAFLLLASPPGATAAPAVGDATPPFFAVDLKGESYSQDQTAARNRTFIVFFWALHNAPSLREMTALEEIQGRYREKGLVVLGVEAKKNDRQQVLDILEKLKAIELNPTFPIVPDPQGTLTADFDVREVPETFLIDRTGHVQLHMSGFTPERKAQIENAVENVFSPRPSYRPEVSPPSTRSEEPVRGGEAPTITERIEAPAKALTQTQEEFEKNRYFGDFYYNRQEFDRAAGYYEKCISLDPANIYVRLKLGDLHARKKDFVKAREVWEGILKIDPSNKEAEDNLRRLIRGDF